MDGQQILLIVGWVVLLSVCIYLIGTKLLRASQSSRANVPEDYSIPATVSERRSTFSLGSDQIVWIEREMVQLNRAIHGEDRPNEDLKFFQKIPAVLLDRDILLPGDVAVAAENLKRQTLNWLNRSGARKWDVPFRNPVVEFMTHLPGGEPGHIEFRNDRTIIRIHPKFAEDPFALSAILCHELAHFVLDHNGFQKADPAENEKLTDLFVFKCGQGLIYLQGIVDLTQAESGTVENRLGYLSIEEMAYAHVRSSMQFGLSIDRIVPTHFGGKTFLAARQCIDYLRSLETDQLCEIVVCPNNHVLRLSRDRPVHTIRCPKCKWKKEIWLHKGEQFQYLISDGVKFFDAGEYSRALENFRTAEQVDRTNSIAYCWASRSLKACGKHQDAIRELKRFLEICPNDEQAINEMKLLIY